MQTQLISWQGWGLGPIEKYAQLKSTNERARGRIEAGCRSGTVIWAEEQTQGRGRLDRVWFSNQDCLTFSVALIVPHSVQLGALPLVAGVGVAEALAPYQPEVAVKWPNDIWIGSHKLGGILCEGFCREQAQWVIIGIGLNINGIGSQLSSAGGCPITLAESTNCTYEPYELLVAVLTGLDRNLRQFFAGKLDLDRLLRQRGNFLGRTVSVSGSRSLVGMAKQVLPDGRLVVSCPSGDTIISSGDVSLVPS